MGKAACLVSWRPQVRKFPLLVMKKQQPPSISSQSRTTWSRSGINRFSQLLLREWTKLDLPVTDAIVVAAVSGGADSVALLMALDELNKSKRLNLRILVAHLNHRLRGKASEIDAKWVGALAKKLGHKATVGAIDVKRLAAKTGDNLEQAARRARYEFLAVAASKVKARLVLTGHTMDDQAETVLMNLLRGSGAQGLGGVEMVRPITSKSDVLLARPLLSWARRRETESYCQEKGVEFRSDEMNLDEGFSRVRVRRQLLPLMETFNPNLVEGLARTAELLREDSAALDRGAATLLDLSVAQDTNLGANAGIKLKVDLLAAAPSALRRRALRLWIRRCRGDLRRLERVHIIALENLLLGVKGGRVIELPGGSRVSRKRGVLEYGAPDSR